MAVADMPAVKAGLNVPSLHLLGEDKLKSRKHADARSRGHRRVYLHREGRAPGDAHNTYSKQLPETAAGQAVPNLKLQRGLVKQRRMHVSRSFAYLRNVWISSVVCILNGSVLAPTSSPRSAGPRVRIRRRVLRQHTLPHKITTTSSRGNILTAAHSTPSSLARSANPNQTAKSWQQHISHTSHVRWECLPARRRRSRKH